MLTRSESAATLRRHLRRPQVNHILHGFPSVRMWDAQPDPDVECRSRPPASDELALDLYVGIPFCIKTEPDRCGYCLFPTEEFERSSQVDAYLSLLRQEIEQWAGRLDGRTIRSIYIGGGTPNLLKARHYGPLMATIAGAVGRMPGPEAITLEGIPQLFGRSRLEAMAEAGIGRVSMGAQQLDTELAALSGRGQTAEDVFRSVEDAHACGLASNVDLIFGWPRQTVDTMLRDLEALANLPVDHITHYELNVGGPTDFALNRRDELPDPATIETMYLEAARALRSMGFDQRTSYDFQRRSVGDGPDFVYEEGEADLQLHEVIGWGQAAISEVVDATARTATTWMNQRSLHAYADAVERGRAPVETGFHRAEVDLQLLVLFRSIQALRVDGAAFQRLFGCSLDSWASSWDVLEDEGLVWRDGGDVVVTERGGYRVPTIQAVVAEERLRELKDRRWRRVDPTDAAAGTRTSVPVTIEQRG
ncbi:MAG: coproporphyrinogen-III oxidase family protein [Aquihabitans sp.]